MTVSQVVRRAQLLSTLWLASLAGCAAPASTTPRRGAVEAPRTHEPLDLATLADRLGKGSPPPRPIWSTLPAHARRAIELRLSTFATAEQKLVEIERRRSSFDLRDEAGAVAFAELFFLLEELAFGPPSPARTEAQATLATLYGMAERTGDFARWSERLAKSLDLPQREGDFSPFLRAFADGGAGMHRAFVAATLREGAPRSAVARALLAHAWQLHGKGDLDQALAMREIAVRVDPDQPADTWLTLAVSYVVTLDAERAAIAVERSKTAPADRARPDELTRRREDLARRIARARAVHDAGPPTTPAARLALGEALRDIGAEARAEQVLKQCRDELPGDARPHIALARLSLQRSDGKDLSVLARQIVASLDAARRLEHPTTELYELLIGVSGLTALEDVLGGGKEPDEMARRAGDVLAKLRAANVEHAKLAPERAAVLDVVLDLGTAGIAEGPRFIDALPALLRASHPRGRAVLARYPTDPAARVVGVGLASFAADPADAFTFVVAKPAVPDPPLLVATRAEIALDLALSKNDVGMVERARALADEVPPGERVRDARTSAVRGDVEVFLARAGKGSLADAERHYRDALRGLPPAEQTRIKSNLACVLAESGRVEPAVEAFRDAVSTASKETSAAMALAAMATLALAARQPDDALALTDRSLALDADSAMALFTRALAKKQLGRSEDARADAQRALERVDRHAKVMPDRLWGQRGAFGDATLDFNLGISSDSPRYDLRLSAFHRVWWLRQSFDFAELRALAAAPTPAAPAAPAGPKKKPR